MSDATNNLGLIGSIAIRMSSIRVMPIVSERPQLVIKYRNGAVERVSPLAPFGLGLNGPIERGIAFEGQGSVGNQQRQFVLGAHSINHPLAEQRPPAYYYHARFSHMSRLFHALRIVGPFVRDFSSRQIFRSVWFITDDGGHSWRMRLQSDLDEEFDQFTGRSSPWISVNSASIATCLEEGPNNSTFATPVYLFKTNPSERSIKSGHVIQPILDCSSGGPTQEPEVRSYNTNRFHLEIAYWQEVGLDLLFIRGSHLQRTGRSRRGAARRVGLFTSNLRVRETSGHALAVGASVPGSGVWHLHFVDPKRWPSAPTTDGQKILSSRREWCRRISSVNRLVAEDASRLTAVAGTLFAEVEPRAIELYEYQTFVETRQRKESEALLAEMEERERREEEDEQRAAARLKELVAQRKKRAERLEAEAWLRRPRPKGFFESLFEALFGSGGSSSGFVNQELRDSIEADNRRDSIERERERDRQRDSLSGYTPLSSTYGYEKWLDSGGAGGGFGR